jgi:hypothetical protein
MIVLVKHYKVMRKPQPVPNKTAIYTNISGDVNIIFHSKKKQVLDLTSRKPGNVMKFWGIAFYCTAHSLFEEPT